MTNLICYDLQGHPIDYFTQWDLNISVDIFGIDTECHPRVCFRNKIATESIVVRPEIIDNGVRVTVPNELLQCSFPVIIEIFYEYDDGSLRTKHIFSVPVVPSLRSTAHQLIKNGDYVDWVKLQEQARVLMNKVNWTRLEDVLVVGVDEPKINDILWFDTTAPESDR